MRFDDIMTDIVTHQTSEGKTRPSETVLADILDALSQVYPMILLANLSKNQYVMLRDNGLLLKDNPPFGSYDRMIEEGVKNIHPSYQGTFLDAFTREKLIARYENDVRQVSAHLYQKGKDGEYQWVITKVIRLEDESGDYVQVCLNEVMPR